MFTDGFIDQIGGKDKKRFKRNNLKNLLLQLQNSTMYDQGIILQETFENWLAARTDVSQSQIDDILVTGVKIT
ncbi:MAG: hypothetical protein HY738_09550 [Bacteroidia bacterium]|nr:hypothetical protein [Bacteroidia bacterium]